MASPDDPSPYLELGHALELTHSYDEALEAYDKAAAIAPASPDGPREGGMRSARWGELEEAARASKRPWSGAPATLKPGTCSASCACISMTTMAPSQAYRSGAAADPKDAECWLGLATVGVVRGDPKLALDAYDQVLARSPRFALRAARPGVGSRAARSTRRGGPRARPGAGDGRPPEPVAKQRAALANPPGPHSDVRQPELPR